jgi:rfaE bifunctional protein kinase chain/domain/rfaE bifunctional protein nucleotidyltransferase chain/domain
MPARRSHADAKSPSARAKIKSTEELATIAEQARRSGRTVALCHGVFDLVHLGHVRHIESASKEADVLIVTVTADRYVNKGPGRPIFPEAIRAEMLAAIGNVDWVGISHAATAEMVLEAIRPNVYVKGADYENPDDDITDKIRNERETVEKYGGHLVFTKDITFSSSNLINRYLDIYDLPLRDHLERLRDRGVLDRIMELTQKISDFKVAIIGDAIIDEYQYVSALGKSPKEQIIATLAKNSEKFAGGVFAAANHVANFCREVSVVSALGDDDNEAFIRSALKPNVALRPIHLPKRPTTRKLRYVGPNYMRKMFEVYSMDDSPYPPEERVAICDAAAEVCRDADLVIVTDFGHGLFDPRTVERVAKSARFLAVNTQTNSANFGYNLITKYRRADYICLDAPEARLATSNPLEEVPALITERLAKIVDCPNIIVTHGSYGSYSYQVGNSVTHTPAFTKTVVDTIGAGDAYFAVTAPFVAAGAEMDVAGFIGNAAGAMKVGIVGHRASVEKVPFVKFVTALLR